jgi:hypothetical protein
MLDVQYIIGLEEHVELHDPLLLTRDEEDKDNHNLLDDEDQPNTKRNHANDPLEVPIGPITDFSFPKFSFLPSFSLSLFLILNLFL